MTCMYSLSQGILNYVHNEECNHVGGLQSPEAPGLILGIPEKLF